MNLATHPLATIPALPGVAKSLPSGERPRLIDEQHPLRSQVEQFIAQRFLDMHGARINCLPGVTYRRNGLKSNSTHRR